MTYADVMEMNIGDAMWFIERVNENREAEARAVEEAHASAKQKS